MRTTSGLLILALAVPAAAQERPLPPPDHTPVLRIGQDAPPAPVNAVAFAPDGSTLYAGGLDKVVRAYTLQGGRFREAAPVRLPIGPGNAGAVNAVAVSPDGRWLAVAGRDPMRGEAVFGQDGVVIDTRQLPPAMWRDMGVVYLFDRTNPNGGKVLRGHRGEVRAVAFADPTPAGGPVLVSAGLDRGEDGKTTGAVRVWDVTTGTQLAARIGFPASPTRPGLAAWPAGNGKKDLRVAVAWPGQDPQASGELLVWDVAAGKVRTFPDGGFNLPLAVRHGRDGSATEVVSGGFWSEPGPPASGRLVARPTTGNGFGRVIAFPKEDAVYFLPLAVAPVGESLAVLLETTAKPAHAAERSAELRLLGPDGSTSRRIPLSGVSARWLPFLTASRDGLFVAVGGFTDRRVEVYDVAALAAGKAARQVLPGADGGFTGVSFLEGGKLWVGEQGQTPARGGLVFDFAARQAAPNDGRGKVESPAVEIPFDADKPEVVVRVGGRQTVCRLRPRERPTAVAYLPAGPGWKPALGPVIAVAHTDPTSAVTLVTLFDGANGRRLRQLVGPELPVQGLAFSAARPLLAAVSGDRTVSVWSLKDIDRETGVVEGLLVADAEGGVAVATVAADAPEAVRGLKPGDVIEGFVGAGDKVEPVKSAKDFGWAVRARPVGGTVAVRLKGRPNPVALPVGRGVEQRGPLFSLWLAPGGKANTDWVGWSPNGPYDAGSPAAEARIGWLTATGDPAAPVAFAGADQYRKTYYRKDVLKFLTEKGELAAAVDAQTDAYPPPPPRLRVQIAGAVQQPGGPTLLRDKKAELRVELSDLSDEFPLDRAVLRWRAIAAEAGPGDWQSLPLADRGHSLAIDLSGHRWVRGRHTVEVELRRTPASPPGATAATDVVYAPPPPTVTALVGGKPADGVAVATEADTVQVGARVDSPASEADVNLTWADPTGERGSAALAAKGGEFTPAEVKLKPGRTSFRLTATTRGAGEYAEYESRATEFAVVYTPPKTAPPPQVGRLTATPAGEPRTIAGRPVLVTDTPKVHLTSVIEADEPITDVEWDGGDGKWHPMPPGPAGAKKLTASRDVILPRGDVRIVRVRAKSKRSEFATTVAELAYHPPLPAVKLAAFPASVTTREFTAAGTFTGGPDAAPFKLAVVIGSAGGKSRTVQADVDAAAETWKAAITLEPGDNRLGLTVRNDWREESRANLGSVAFRRPPRDVRIRPVDAGDKGVADVVATVTTADGMDPTVLLVNGRPVPTDSPRKVSAQPGEVRWEVTAPSVPLAPGGQPERLAVSVRNADGDSETVTVAVKRMVVSLKPPVIALADGAQDRTTDRPRLPVGFKVTSATKLTRVEVWQADRAGAEFERVAAVDPATAAQAGDGFTLTANADVGLRPGVNRVKVTAVNSGGAAEASFAVSYTLPGARVVIDAVEEVGPDGAAAKPLDRRTAGAGEVFGPAADGFVRVRGRVRWPADDAPAARDPGLTAVLFANGVAHLPIQLDPPGGPGSERRFVAPVFLNAKDTAVRVELRAAGRSAALPQQAVGGAEFRIRCQTPLAQQRLHVVVVGVDVPADRRFELVKEMVASLGGSVPADRAGRFDRGEFKVGAFAQSILYPPLVGEVDDGNITFALDEVGREIRRLSSGRPGRWLNDFILVYYQGKDWVGPDGRRWLHTSRSLQYPEPAAARFAVPVDGLPSTPGVRLLVLNVADPGQSKPVGDALAAGPPFLRYGWKEPAATGRFFPLLQKAVESQKTVGGVASEVGTLQKSEPQRAGAPVESLPPELRDRIISNAAK